MDRRFNIGLTPPANQRSKVFFIPSQEDHYSPAHQGSSSLEYSRFKKMQDSLLFSKKAKSHKKHYANNLHDQSHIKYLGTCQLSAKLQSSHDKLDIKDILGASPDTFRNEIFKNRMYGKKIDRKHIFASPLPLPECLQQDKNIIKSHLPKISNDEFVPRQFRLKETKKEEETHPARLNINTEVIAMRFPEEKDSRSIQVQAGRRIKTQMDNPENHFNEYRKNPEINIRRWNPTYLTDTSNPLLYNFLPKIK